MAFIQLNGIAADTVSVHLPQQGCWVADVALPELVPTSGAAELIVGDLTLTGAVDPARSGTFQTRSTLTVVGGLGWRRRVPARAHHNDAGIKASAILEPVAGLVGESVADASSERLGVDWVRPEGPASHTLQRIAPGWYVGLDGITYTQPRFESPSEVTGEYDLLSFDPVHRVAMLKAATLSVVSIGSVLRDGLDTPLLVTSLDIIVRAGALRLRAMGVDHV